MEAIDYVRDYVDESATHYYVVYWGGCGQLKDEAGEPRSVDVTFTEQPGDWAQVMLAQADDSIWLYDASGSEEDGVEVSYTWNLKTGARDRLGVRRPKEGYEGSTEGYSPSTKGAHRRATVGPSSVHR